MATETGPLTEKMFEDACRAKFKQGDVVHWDEMVAELNSALAPLLAAKCALAAAEMREKCVSRVRALAEIPVNTPEQNDLLRYVADEHIHPLPIPDEDSLRGLVECAIGAGRKYDGYLCSPGNANVGLMEKPTLESVLREYIERGRHVR